MTCEKCGMAVIPGRFVVVESKIMKDGQLRVYLWPCRCLPERQATEEELHDLALPDLLTSIMCAIGGGV